MLALAVFVVFQSSKFDKFMAECNRAIHNVSEGVWSYSALTEGHRMKTEIFLKGKTFVTSTEVDQKPYMDALASPGHFLAVMYGSRQFSEYDGPKPPDDAKPDPLPPIEFGSFDYRLVVPQGLFVRANPPLLPPEIVVAKGTETLRTKAVKPDGSILVVTLVRDFKSKLPQKLTFKSAKGAGEIDFSFVARKLKDEEVAIPKSKYDGFEKVDPSSGTPFR